MNPCSTTEVTFKDEIKWIFVGFVTEYKSASPVREGSDAKQGKKAFIC